jgi:hypothetical protein
MRNACPLKIIAPIGERVVTWVSSKARSRAAVCQTYEQAAGYSRIDCSSCHSVSPGRRSHLAGTHASTDIHPAELRDSSGGGALCCSIQAVIALLATSATSSGRTVNKVAKVLEYFEYDAPHKKSDTPFCSRAREQKRAQKEHKSAAKEHKGALEEQ